MTKMASNKTLLIGALLLLGLFVIVPALNTSGTFAGIQGSTETSCQTIVSQTTQVSAYDADKTGTAVATPTVTVYTDASTGAKFAGGNSTVQLGTYDLLVQKSNYQSVLFDNYKTGCEAAVSPSAFLKQFDTGITVTVYDSNGVTANNASPTYNQTIGNGASATVHVKLQQSAAYKHLGGVNNQFVVWANSTNASDWDSSQESMVFDGTPCSFYTGKQANAIAVGVVKNAFICTGDFAPNDGAIHSLDYKAQAASGTDPSSQLVTLSFAPMDYYIDTITSKVSTGAVKNDGSAIVALQTASVYYG
jgi:hypothetical protein